MKRKKSVERLVRKKKRQGRRPEGGFLVALDDDPRQTALGRVRARIAVEKLK